jgi:outer membrane protein TolC
MRISISLFVCAWPVVVLAEPPLSLARVQELAASQQPGLAALEAGAASARHSAVAEGQLPDPRLKLSLLNVPIQTFSLTEDPMTQTMIAVEQMIPGGEKRELRRRRMEAEAGQLDAELAAQRAAVRRDAGLAFLNLVGTARQLALLRELQAQTRIQVDAQRIGAATGRVAQADALAARQMLTMAKDRESEIATQLAVGRAELARWIGAAAAEPLPDSLPELPAPPPLAELEVRLAAHPSHSAQAGSVAAAQADLALAREATKPDKSIEIGYGKRSPQFGDMVSVQFAMELPLFPGERQDRQIASRQAQLERARALEEDHLRMLRADLAALYAQWNGAGDRLRRIEGELAVEAGRRAEAALAAYRAGRGELAAVLEARRAEIEARLQVVQLATQAARLRLQIGFYEHAGEGHGQPR